MNQSTILVVDDDPAIRDVITYALAREGFEVCEARDGHEAISQWEHVQPALIVLDIGLPEKDGYSICRSIRAQAQTPIIFVSSRDEELDKLLGLEMGGDDYLTKPFSPRELVARVKAVLRRLHAPTPKPDTKTRLQFGELILDSHTYEVFWETNPIVLTATEFSMLRSFMEMPRKVFSRNELMASVYGYDVVVSDRTVDSHIRRLRKKCAAAGCEALIRTHHGKGYQLAEPTT